MPTINQLVKNKRRANKKKSRSVALLSIYNTNKRKDRFIASPFKRGVCVRVYTMTPKKTELGPEKSGQG